MFRHPRYFVPDEPATAPPPAHGELHPLGLATLSGRRFALTLDAGGALAAHPADTWSHLSPGARRLLNAATLAGRTRDFAATELWLFAAGRALPAGSTPGTNDPIELEGRCFGPFPSATPGVAAGRLTVTRGELLDAAVRGRWRALMLGGEPARSVTGLLLPGDDASATARGEGLVLAVPLLGVAPELGEVANDASLAQLLHGLLSAVRDDQLGDARGSLASRTLPVPNPAAARAELEARGFVVDGPVARRPRRGLLGRLLPERREVPVGATVDEFLQIAEVALSEMPDWPSGRAIAIRGAERLATVTWEPATHTGLVLAEGPRLEPGAEAIESAPAAGQGAGLEATRRALGFTPDPGFLRHAGAHLEAELELLDHGAGDLVLEVPRPKGGVHRARHAFSGSAGWHRVSLTFADPVAGAEPTAPPGAQVRLELQSAAPVLLRRLRVSSAPTPADPAGPTPGRRPRRKKSPRSAESPARPRRR